MSFKKLNTTLLEKMQELGITEPTAFQKTLIPKIKSGASLFALAPTGAGKTEALIISVLHKLKMEEGGDNPLALIFVKDKEAVTQLESRFLAYTLYSGVRVQAVNDDHTILNQRDAIYKGADIVIGTPRTLSKLYFFNGINLMELKLIAVEDAGFLTGTSFHTDIDRISESIPKCQHLILAEKMDARLEQLKGLFMENAIIVN